MKKIKAVFLVFLLCTIFCSCEQSHAYRQAHGLLEAGQYDEAISAFSGLGDYKDSKYIISTIEKEKAYTAALDLLASGEYAQALDAFSTLGDYKDSLSYLARFQEIPLSPDNWKEYFEIKETQTPLQNSLGEYTEVQVNYYMVLKEDVAARFYAPLSITSYRASASCTEKFCSLDPKTGIYWFVKNDYCLPADTHWIVYINEISEDSVFLETAMKHPAIYDYLPAGYVYSLLHDFSFSQLEGTIYIYE